MLNGQALQAHILTQHKSLVTWLADNVESLENPRFKGLYDAGLWLSPNSHLTVIYTYADTSAELSDCTFQIGAHGKEARAMTSFEDKYSEDLSLSELDEELFSIQANLVSSR